MDSAMIVSYSKKGTDYLSDILSEISITNIINVSNAGEARRMYIDNDFDLCIINTPLPDEFGEGLARSIAMKQISEVILIVNSELFDEISHKVEDYGVITISKPISKSLLWNSIKIAQATYIRLKKIQVENKKLLKQIDDLKIIDRAKCILISNLNLSEEEAHKYIEKNAMDKRVTRRELADEIIKKYSCHQGE